MTEAALPIEAEYAAPTEVRMSTSLLELEAQVLSLGPTERAHLLERLIDSFEPETAIRESWIAEARRRHEQVKSGRVTASPGTEAVARIRTRISRPTRFILTQKQS